MWGGSWSVRVCTQQRKTGRVSGLNGFITQIDIARLIRANGGACSRLWSTVVSWPGTGPIGLTQSITDIRTPDRRTDLSGGGGDEGAVGGGGASGRRGLLQHHGSLRHERIHIAGPVHSTTSRQKRREAGAARQERLCPLDCAPRRRIGISLGGCTDVHVPQGVE